jgi:hypothetical protein
MSLCNVLTHFWGGGTQYLSKTLKGKNVQRRAARIAQGHSVEGCSVKATRRAVWGEGRSDLLQTPWTQWN